MYYYVCLQSRGNELVLAVRRQLLELVDANAADLDFGFVSKMSKCIDLQTSCKIFETVPVLAE